MRLAITLGLCALLSVGPALAAPLTNDATGISRAATVCGWSAEMEDDEGGPVMVASSCESDTEFGPALRLVCVGEISVRYYDVEMEGEPPASGALLLTSGGTSLSADVVFEEMDGAFAAYLEMGSPIISLLKTGNEVGVTLKGVDLPPRMISLHGSSAAIEKLIDACK